PEGQVVLDGPAAVAVPLELDLGAAVLTQPVEVAGERVTGGAVELVAVVGEVDVLQNAVLLGRQAPLLALEARAARPETLLAQTRARARAGLARLRALLLAGTRERQDEQQGQRDAPRARGSHAHRLPSARCRRLNPAAATRQARYHHRHRGSIVSASCRPDRRGRGGRGRRAWRRRRDSGRRAPTTGSRCSPRR